MTTIEIIQGGKTRTIYALGRQLFDSPPNERKHRASAINTALYTSSVHMYARHMSETTMSYRASRSSKRCAGRKGKTLRNHRSD